MRAEQRLLQIAAATVLAVGLLAAPAWAEVKDYKNLRGFVDKAGFTDLVGEDDVQIEVWLPGSLLQIVKAVDPELGDLVDGLELAQALVVETDDPVSARKLTERLRATESNLLKRGWIRLAKIKEGTEQVSVLILSDDEAIHGLTVMVIESGDNASFVFANVVGLIDLAAIQRLGEQMNIPGLNEIRTERE